jgi:hypothetical protein
VEAQHPHQRRLVSSKHSNARPQCGIYTTTFLLHPQVSSF